MRLLRTERRPPNQALKHDRSQAPPIASKVVSLSAEDFGGDIIGCTDCRVGELSTGFTPRIDLLAIRNGELDLVEVDGLAVIAVGTVFATCEELLVIRGFVLFVETSGETEVSEFDVAATVEQDVVWFDVTGIAC
jgi:hypothetical protein